MSTACPEVNEQTIPRPDYLLRVEIAVGETILSSLWTASVTLTYTSFVTSIACP